MPAPLPATYNPYPAQMRGSMSHDGLPPQRPYTKSRANRLLPRDEPSPFPKQPSQAYASASKRANSRWRSGRRHSPDIRESKQKTFSERRKPSRDRQSQRKRAGDYAKEAERRPRRSGTRDYYSEDSDSDSEDDRSMSNSSGRSSGKKKGSTRAGSSRRGGRELRSQSRSERPRGRSYSRPDKEPRRGHAKSSTRAQSEPPKKFERGRSRCARKDVVRDHDVEKRSRSRK